MRRRRWPRCCAGAVYSCSVKQCTAMDETVSALTHGHCAVIFDTLQTALCFEVRSETRAPYPSRRWRRR